MESATWLIIVLTAVFCVLLIIGANAIEDRYQRMHPPDNFDGCSEDDWQDNDSEPR
ncbi:MAG: hypothetical protein IKE04_02790 [Oscillospiraceae bacterium]|nr:hypothetical protein [Oscillospiraceae bacterium]